MNSDSILDKYRSDHLFLLMGRNPLPNYVAARLLLKPGGTLYLVHTVGPGGTGTVAQKLAAHFSKPSPYLIPVDPLDTFTLRKQIAQCMEKIQNASVGLNYTGGTKIMAIHAYRAVEEFCRQRGREEPIFSYLDADTLQMIIEQAPAPYKVVEGVDLSLKELFDLHGIRLSGQLQTEPLLLEIAQALAQMHGTSTGVKAWQDSRKILTGCEGRLWQEVKAELLSVGATTEVVTHLEEALGLKDTESINLSTAAQQANLKSSRELILWLDGIWLENWALACVKELDYPHRAYDLVGYSPQRFQIDVAVMRGYQLFALSCSVTTERKPAKLKLLEIYIRARQLGGDEARMGLVCAVDDPQGLQQEITAEWDTGHRVRVFGAQQLPDLKNYLDKWFRAT